MRPFTRLWPLLSLGVGVTAAATLVGFNDAAQPLIYLILTVALYVFVGNSGIVSFGHIGFMALGAYAGALLTIPVLTKDLLLPDLPAGLGDVEVSTAAALVIASVFVGLIGYVVAVPLMRLSGLAASIASLSLLVIIQDVLRNYDALTGGAGTLTGIPTDTTLPMLVGLALATMAVAFAYQESRFGLRLRAAREDEVAARASGIAVERERRLAFAVSAMLTAVGGVLYGHYLGSLTTSAFFLDLTFLIIAMLVVGGMRSLAGAVLGAAVLSAFTNVFDSLEGGAGLVDLPGGSREILSGVFVIAILMWRPEGLSGGREITWPFGRRSTPKATEGAQSLSAAKG